MQEFSKDRFPLIKLHPDCFEIKAIDYWEYRTFNHSEVISVQYFNEGDEWWFWPIISVMQSRFGSFKLKIVTKSGSDWVYHTASTYNKEFAAVIDEIKKRSGSEQ